MSKYNKPENPRGIERPHKIKDAPPSDEALRDPQIIAVESGVEDLIWRPPGILKPTAFTVRVGNNRSRIRRKP